VNSFSPGFQKGQGPISIFWFFTENLRGKTASKGLGGNWGLGQTPAKRRKGQVG